MNQPPKDEPRSLGPRDSEFLNRFFADSTDWLQRYIQTHLHQRWKGKHLASDVAQDGFLRFLEYVNKHPDKLQVTEAELRGLLARITLNAMIDGVRRRKARAGVTQHGAGLDSGADQRVARVNPVTLPDLRSQKNEDQETIRLALSLLTPDDCQILTQRELEGLSFREIGLSLGLSEDAVRMRYRRKSIPMLFLAVNELLDGKLPQLEES